VVDGILQLIQVVMASRADSLPGGISHSITNTCSEGWPLVPIEDLGPGEDFCNCLDFHPSWMRDSLDLVSWSGGDAQVSQQCLKPTGGDRSFNPEGLHLLSIFVHLLTLCAAQGRVLLVIFIFILDIVVLILLLLLLFLSRCALGCRAPRYHQLDPKRLLLLRCVQ
jgi:hypothetical protein